MINKFFLWLEKMHLRLPGFTFYAYESFTESKEK